MSEDNFEGEEEELTEEDKKERLQKIREIERRAHGLQAEAIGVMLSEKERTHIEGRIKELFTEKGLLFSLPYMKAMCEGIEFGIAKSRENEQMTLTVLYVLRRMVGERERAVAKSKENVPGL